MNRIIRGAPAGLIATVPMTIVIASLMTYAALGMRRNVFARPADGKKSEPVSLVDKAVKT